jgi:hypothetical protein
MDWFFDGKLNFSKHLLFIIPKELTQEEVGRKKILQKEKEKNSDLKPQTLVISPKWQNWKED